MQIPRTQFEAGALAWLQEPAKDLSGKLSDRAALGWQWSQQPFTGHGYLIRAEKPIKLDLRQERPREPQDSESIVEDQDEANADRPVFSGTASTQVMVSYSPSYQVPVLYFRAHDTAGSPIPLERILTSSFLRAHRSEYPFNTLDEDKAVDPQAPASFPAISQGEHPETNKPCHFLHPCETASVLNEVLGSSSCQPSPLQIMKTWFMLVGSVFDIT